MIDLLKAKEEFKKYVEKYDSSNVKIELKIEHTYRTEKVAEKIAKSLNLSEEEILLAGLIGLLHDIGRFEQLKLYDTYSDIDTIDHADLGVEILFSNNFIKNFIEDRKYDNVIYKAVKNHNKLKIEDGLSEKELLHTKIIRDADKTDIYEVVTRDIVDQKKKLYNFNEAASQTISEEVLKDFLQHNSIDRRKVKNEIDNVILLISFIYDYNFNEGLNIIKQNKYMERIIYELEKTGKNIEQTNLIKTTVLTFLDKK